MKFHGANLFSTSTFAIESSRKERERCCEGDIGNDHCRIFFQPHIEMGMAKRPRGWRRGLLARATVPGWLAADYLFGKEDWDGGSGGRNESTCLFIQPDVPFK